MRINSDCQLRSKFGKTRTQKPLDTVKSFQWALASAVDVLPQALYRCWVKTQTLKLVLDPFDALLQLAIRDSKVQPLLRILLLPKGSFKGVRELHCGKTILGGASDYIHPVEAQASRSSVI